MKPLVEILNVVKRLGSGERSFMLRIEHFAVEAAQELALVGESGSGKTTLLNLLSGIITPDEGMITLAGTSIGGLAESNRDRFRAEHVGCVYQTFNLLQGLTARENVLLATMFSATGSIRQESARYADTLLSRLGLADKQNRKPRELSVGEQQRVAVARALVNKPMLILADEPTASVDAANAARVIDEMRSLARETGATVIVITHDKAVQSMFPTSVSIREIVSSAHS
jgi:putative ABC transport system ATP-binding protein